VSDFVKETRFGLANVVGSRVGLGQTLLPMVGETSDAGGFEARLAGFADGGPASFVLVIGGDVADPGMEPGAGCSASG
jgi:hypothetical protein